MISGLKDYLQRGLLLSLCVLPVCGPVILSVFQFCQQGRHHQMQPLDYQHYEPLSFIIY